ncbi:FHA domain-containing protein [Singulisphaera sp. PoT]|uniref:FHA domain-containing protein n=1 Tax=Singulisphaera sp. PoT TaxID=3411797 RepID=UPI003BF4A1F8
MSPQFIPLSAGPFPAISLQRPVLLIGRHPECDVRLDLSKISRRHCCIALAYDRILIRDLGSRNGVRVNGRPVDEALLNHGDEVAIGPLIYRLENLPVAALAPSPSRPPLPPLPSSANGSPSESDEDLIPLD